MRRRDSTGRGPIRVQPRGSIRQAVPSGRSSRTTPSPPSRLRISSARAKFFSLRSLGPEFARAGRAGRAVSRSWARLGLRGGLAEEAEDLGQLLEDDHPGAVLVEPPVARSLERQGVGEAVQGVDQLEQLAERAAGVEVVVHRVEEPLAVLGDLREQGRVAGVEVGPAGRRLEPVEAACRSGVSNRSKALRKVCRPRFSSSSRDGP